MPNYMSIFETLIAELQNCENIEVIHASAAPGEGADYVNQVLQREGLQASPEYVEFFADVDFVRIEWEVPAEKLSAFGLGDTPMTSGRVYIPSFETTLSDIKLEGYWFNIAKEGFLEANKSKLDQDLLPFDYFEPDISGCSGLEYDGKRIGEKMFYFDHQTGILSLSVNIEGYVASIARTKGIYGWQKSRLVSPAAARDLNDALRRIFGDV